MKIMLEGDPEPLEVTEDLLWAEVLPRIMPFSASLYVGKEREDTQPAPCGSATLVFADGPSLLTAAHVWEHVRKYEWLFVALDSVSMPTARHPLAMPVKGLEPRFITQRLSDDWGPDVALIPVPEPHAGKIAVSKAFYHLDRRRPAALASMVRLSEGLWAVLGPPYEQSKFGPDESVVRPTVFASTIGGTAERDSYDYLEFLINREGKPDGYLPKSYEGMSGSGLWRVDVRRSAKGGVVIPDDGVALEGIAFLQDPGDGIRGFLRCHGRATIYGRMMGEIAAPSVAQ